MSRLNFTNNAKLCSVEDHLKKSSWVYVIPVLTLEGAGLSFSCRTSIQWSARKLIYLALPENGSTSEQHWEMKPDGPQNRSRAGVGGGAIHGLRHRRQF